MTAPLSILLADASTFFLTLERQFLKGLPVTVYEARSAPEALVICREQRPGLVYMAFDLLGGSGSDCCRQLKADPSLEAIPVIMLYDLDHPEQLAACRQAGCNGTLAKPIDRHEFVEAGRAFLPGIRERRQPCLFQITFRRDGETFSGKCLDFSKGGLFIETSEQPTPGESLQLEFQVPGKSTALISCTCTVTWLNIKGGGLKSNYPAGFGVKFNEMSKQSAQLIGEYLGRRG